MIEMPPHKEGSFPVSSADRRAVSMTDRCSSCDFYRGALLTIADTLDLWKSPLLDPDGRDCSEAVIRLMAEDIRGIYLRGVDAPTAQP
jgi:hypothetical protein